ncbi:spore germination protein [Alicyclobacillus sp. SO9]|uniref:spore germination protein n=1 Tax=Alicyclobacillus sp. SO9 TaxID=2665646 RepID=UPI0018E841DF|nr:spore germination protein [Alicyclobacillus sp. SO9]QQE80839.1 spore germination protein [Alicyclobacillus sp. SO9]
MRRDGQENSRRNRKSNESIRKFETKLDDSLPNNPVPESLEEFESEFNDAWDNCSDVKVSHITVSGGELHVSWINALTDRQNMQHGILSPITTYHNTLNSLEDVEHVLASAPVEHLANMADLHRALTNGRIAIYLDGNSEALAIDVSNMPGKAIEISQGEPTIEGPQEAYTESLETNLAMIRKKLRTPHLKIESTSIGTLTHSAVTLLYVDSVVSKDLVTEVRQRLARIDVDAIIDINYIREMTKDAPLSIFPTTESTERPDKTISALVQGRAAIMVQGSPHSLLVPATFLQFINSPEDMYSSYWLATPVRFLRNLMFWSSILLPSLYVSLLSYHQDLIPTPLLISLEGQHEGIPFPTVVEAFLMQFFFEALREAGQRLPRAVGQSVSIVGGLVIGDAAVNAGIVSPGMVIVVATTGVASFTLASYSFVNTTRVLQFAFLTLAGLMGLYGVMIGGLILVTHLVSLRSYGVPYMTPVAPATLGDMRDAVFRAPWWAMKTRPAMYHLQDRQRTNTPKPGPKAGQ